MPGLEGDTSHAAAEGDTSHSPPPSLTKEAYERGLRAPSRRLAREQEAQGGDSHSYVAGGEEGGERRVSPCVVNVERIA